MATHCCFCGQQCGINLKVKDNLVIGFEPRYDFPFNKGMLCPKGVKRYLQGGHPDRLDDRAAARSVQRGRASRRWRTTRRSRASHPRSSAFSRTYGPNAFGVLSGASLTTEKAYLMGKFARVCLKTKYIDYNGRLCMVSAGAANKKAFGIDRAANPWDDILNAEVVLIAGSNTAECSPITTNYVWQARENGGKVIVVDPRITPIARTADLFLPVKPGRDVALFNGILHLMIENDWLDHDFIEKHTVGFEAVAEHVKQWTPQRTAEVTGVAEKSIRAAAELWGQAKTSFLMHARGIEHHSHGVENCLSTINIVLASGRIGRPYCALRHRRRPGQRAGRPRARAEGDQLPGWRDISESRAPRVHRRRLGREAGGDPGGGRRLLRDDAQDRRGRDQGPAPDLLQPEGLAAGQRLRHARAGEARVLHRHRFLPQRDRAARRHRPSRLAARRRRRRRRAGRRARHQDQQGRRSARRREAGLAHHPGHRRSALGRPHGFTFDSPRAIFDELRVASKGGVADYFGITYEKIEANNGVFWPCPTEDHPGTPRLFEPGSWNPIAKGAGPFYFPDGKARFNVAAYRPPAEDVDEEYPVILTTGRVVSQFLSGTQTRRARAARLPSCPASAARQPDA